MVPGLSRRGPSSGVTRRRPWPRHSPIPIVWRTAQDYTALLHHHRREEPAVQAQAEVLLTLATAQGFGVYVGYGILLGGWARAMEGQGETGLAQLRQGLARCLADGADARAAVLSGPAG